MARVVVKSHKIATVVTYLEMRVRPRPAPLPTAPLRLMRWKAPALERYRTLFRRVGEPWLWFSRLVLPDDEVSHIIRHEAVEVYAVTDPRGIEIGLLELDFRALPACSLAFFALVPQLTGKGFGHWLMAQSLMLAWRKGVEVVQVHTCTLDHPNALGFYLRSGFVAVRREIETFDDPRAKGILAQDAAPHVPMIIPKPADISARS